VRVWGVRVGVELVGEQTAFNKKNSNDREGTYSTPTTSYSEASEGPFFFNFS